MRPLRVVSSLGVGAAAFLATIAASAPAHAQANAWNNCGDNVLVCPSKGHFANIVAAAQAGNIAEVDRIARSCKCSRGNTNVKGSWDSAWHPVGLGCYATPLVSGGWMVWGQKGGRPGVCP